LIIDKEKIMSIDTAKQKLFANLMEKAIATSRQLISMLDSEFEALTGNSPVLLDNIINEKKQHLIGISQIMAEQQSLLASMQLTHDEKGVSSLLSTIPANHPWKKNWAKLQKLARIMAEKNLRNGILLSQHTKSTRKALDILTGHRSEPEVYQYGGKSKSRHQSNSIAYA